MEAKRKRPRTDGDGNGQTVAVRELHDEPQVIPLDADESTGAPDAPTLPDVSTRRKRPRRDFKYDETGKLKDLNSPSPVIDAKLDCKDFIQVDVDVMPSGISHSPVTGYVIPRDEDSCPKDNSLSPSAVTTRPEIKSSSTEINKSIASSNCPQVDADHNNPEDNVVSLGVNACSQLLAKVWNDMYSISSRQKNIITSWTLETFQGNYKCYHNFGLTGSYS